MYHYTPIQRNVNAYIIRVTIEKEIKIVSSIYRKMQSFVLWESPQKDVPTDTRKQSCSSLQTWECQNTYSQNVLLL